MPQPTSPRAHGQPTPGPREADVIVDFVFERGVLYVTVENIGDRPALGVATAFDKRFRGLGGTREMTSLPLFRRIEFLAPGREIRTVLDTTAAYFARKEPAKLTATVTYRTTAGQRREATIKHDLTVYRDIAYLTDGAAGA